MTQEGSIGRYLEETATDIELIKTKKYERIDQRVTRQLRLEQLRVYRSCNWQERCQGRDWPYPRSCHLRRIH